MKLSVILLLLTFSVSAQKTKPTPYSLNITNGIFSATFPNSQFVWNTRITPSTDANGSFQILCRNNYVEFFKVLIDYSDDPNHNTWRDTTIEGVLIVLRPNTPDIFIIDTQLRVWRISKPNALILANRLNNQALINSIPGCGKICECENRN